MNRREFLAGIAALGISSQVPAGLQAAMAQWGEPVMERMRREVFRYQQSHGMGGYRHLAIYLSPEDFRRFEDEIPEKRWQDPDTGEWRWLPPVCQRFCHGALSEAGYENLIFKGFPAIPWPGAKGINIGEMPI